MRTIGVSRRSPPPVFVAVLCVLLATWACSGQDTATNPETPAEKNQPPSATLTATPETGPAPLDVEMELTCSDPDGAVALYRLDADRKSGFEIEQSSPIRVTRTYLAATFSVHGECEDDDGASSDRARLHLTVTGASAIAITPDTAATLTDAASFPITARAWDPDGDPIPDPEFTWTSSDPSVAEIDPEGRVTGVELGSATVEAAMSGRTAPALIQVIQADFVSLTGSGVSSCGVMSSGKAYCWGWNAHLGNGSPGEGPPIHTPVPVSGGLSFLNVTSGTGAAYCGAAGSGRAYCWGSGLNGELGTQAATEECPGGEPACSWAPIPVDGDVQFAWAGALYKHSCGITDAGDAYCWGANWGGQSGVAGDDILWTPQPVETNVDFQSIDGGFNHTCGLSVDGTAYCWGSNAFVKGPDGERGPSLEPIGQDQGLSFESLASGGWHACGVTQAGEAWCWGRNDDGQLGAASTDSCGSSGIPCSLNPVRVSGGPSFQSLTAGFHHTCGLSTDGTAYCWGQNDEGQLGLGPGMTGSQSAPQPVFGGLTFTSLDAGRFHTCGVTPDGAAYCWGWNDAGQLGDGSFTKRHRPVRVFGER